MSRVERTQNPTERRGSEHPRETQPRKGDRRSSPGRTPGKAEGEEGDVEEALKRIED